MSTIYLDHAATTPLDPQVLQAMLPYYTECYGNPSSIHAYGRDARRALQAARDHIAQCLGCRPGQLVFTSGGTESDNAAIIGALHASAVKHPHVVTTQVEHQAVLSACAHLERQGVRVAYVPVDAHGRVDALQVEAAIEPDTALISVMYANNEVGTVQPIGEIGAMARSRGIPFHVDAVQALGSIPIDLRQLPVDFMSFSAHKINGPKGVGALYAADPDRLTPRLFGGNQEGGRRAGTENVAGIVGFSEALKLAMQRFAERRERMERYRSAFIDTLRQRLAPGAFAINGHREERLAHILNVSIPGADTEALLISLDLEGVAASGGSACTAGSLEPSHVLRAMGVSGERSDSAVRFSFGWTNSLQEIHIAAQKTATIANRIRMNRK